tara:strand:+ start:4109 stop:4426 length:318 start_codon:yes stop_codon:yes gene_type:complete
MNTGLEFIKKKDKLEEIKNSGLSKSQQIIDYKEYLLNDKNYRFPEFLLEWVAREHLGFQYTEVELESMRNEYKEAKDTYDLQELQAQEEEQSQTPIGHIKNIMNP